VVDALFYKYCDISRPGPKLPGKLTKQQIADFMVPPVHPNKHTPLDSGFTSRDIEVFYKRFRLVCYALDIGEKLFLHHITEEKDKHFGAFCF
jgi:hypothetical protein